MKWLKTVGTLFVDFTHRCKLRLLSIFVCKLEEIPFTTRLKSGIWEGHLTAVVQWRLERSTVTPRFTRRIKAKTALGQRQQTSASKQEMFYRLPGGWTHKTRCPTELIFSKMPVLTCMRKVTWRQHVSNAKTQKTFCLSLEQAVDERSAAVETYSGLIHWPTQWDNNRHSTWALAWVSSRISLCSFKKRE